MRAFAARTIIMIPLALLPVTAAGKLIVRTVDGRVLSLNVRRSEVKSIEFTEGSGGGGVVTPAAIRVFRNVPRQDSGVFKRNPHRGLRMQTKTWDKTPYYLTTPFSRVITLRPGQRCYLSKDAAGTQSWLVDNFLFVKIHTPSGIRRLVIGQHEPVLAGGRRVQKLGKNKFSFGPREIDLSRFMPKGVPFRIDIAALDFGGVGMLSDLFLVIR